MPSPNTKKQMVLMANGPAALQIADVLAMMQPGFWLARHPLTAFRHCALVALIACCHILSGFARSIRLQDWRPGGYDVVRVRRFGSWQTVPLTPQVIFVVERYIAERSRVAERLGVQNEFLFIHRTGRPFTSRDIRHGLDRLRRTIRSRTTIQRMLTNFCMRQLQTGGDEVALRQFRGLKKQFANPFIHLPTIPDERIARLVRRTNPFQKLDRQVRDEAAALKWLADKKLVVPMQLQNETTTLPLEHPFVVKLLRIVWPRGKKGQRVLRARLWDEYGDEIYRLIQAGELNRLQIARLLQTSRSRVQNHIWTHHRNGRRKVRHPPPDVKLSRATQFTENERQTLSALRDALPSDPTLASDEIEQRLIRHFPSVAPLIFQGKITAKAIAEMFGVPARMIQTLVEAAKHGLQPEFVLNRKPGPVSDAWWEKVRSMERERSAEETDLTFFCRLLASGFPGSKLSFENYRKQHPRLVDRTLTDAESETVNELLAIKWSEERKALRRQRDQVLPNYLASIDDLVRAGKISFLRGAELLHIATPVFDFYRQGLRAGLTVTQVLTRPSYAIPKDTWDRVIREHFLTEDEPDVEFFFRMRLTYDFPGGVNAIRNLRYRLRNLGELPQQANDNHA